MSFWRVVQNELYEMVYAHSLSTSEAVGIVSTDEMEKIEAERQWLRYTVLPSILRNGRLVDNYSESKVTTFHVGDIDIDVIGHSEAFMLTFCYRTTINFEYDGQKFQRKMVVKVGLFHSHSINKS